MNPEPLANRTLAPASAQQQLHRSGSVPDVRCRARLAVCLDFSWWSNAPATSIKTRARNAAAAMQKQELTTWPTQSKPRSLSPGSRPKIEELLAKHGAIGFGYGTGGDRAMVAFRDVRPAGAGYGVCPKTTRARRITYPTAYKNSAIIYS